MEWAGMLFLLVILLTVLVTATDWWAVARDKVQIEEFAKPLVMVGLIVVTMLVDLSAHDAASSARPWIVGGLVFGLLGDVFLLPRIDQFIGGLASFLVGHLLYVVGLTKLGFSLGPGLVGLVLGITLLATVGWQVVRGVQGTPLVGPVIAYNVVIAAMVVAAFGSGQPIAIAGALAFAGSDAILGLDRFVLEGPPHRIPIMVLYHLGQAGLVAGMALA